MEVNFEIIKLMSNNIFEKRIHVEKIFIDIKWLDRLEHPEYISYACISLITEKRFEIWNKGGTCYNIL